MSAHIIRPIDPDCNGHTFAELHAFQAGDLARWKACLNAACYLALLKHTKANTRQALQAGQPHRVPRGCALTEFVCNWQPPKKPVCACCGQAVHGGVK